MDRRNGWVENHGSKSLPEKTIMERIMQRFRPIAPKPTAGDSVLGSTAEGRTNEVLGKARKKRKYVRVKQTKCKVEKKKEGVENENIFDFELLERENQSGSSINLDFKVEEKVPWWMKSENKNNGFSCGGGVVDRVDRTVEKVVESWMMVEGVSVISDVWFGEGGGLGGSNMEMMKNLEMDCCPGLISDGFGRVQWVNLAYRKLVAPTKYEGESAAEVVAWLVLKEKLPVVCQAFACTVKVVYPWNNNNNENNDNNNNNNNNNNSNNKNKRYVSHIMPCDVWRMDFGGFAWRLDSKAALSLGR